MGQFTKNFSPPGTRVQSLAKSAAGNRSSSPSRRIAKLNLYLSRVTNRPTKQLASSSTNTHSVRLANIKRWDGSRRTTTQWDCLRKDPELWLSSGDCLIHFYQQGQSRRGASLRVCFADIESSGCGPLLDKFCAYPDAETPPSPTSDSSSSEYFHDPSPPAKYELYIPAPADLSREEAFRYHLTTRNFFAWMFEKPLVGDRLGDALIALLDRINEYRPYKDENLEEFVAYLDDQDYTDFRDCPDHALAALHFSEKYELRELWTDAFAHCAGMNEDLVSSPEFESISRTSKALITRSNLEMDLRIDRAGKSLGAFLEDDLSAAHLGLGKEARVHLDSFRSFLHSFYVAKHGYWPPPQIKHNSSALSRSILLSMYVEFRSLYEYLVDPYSGNTIQDNKPVEGGICVLQNIGAFDKRQKYSSLPHALPLIPNVQEETHRRKPGGLSKLFASKQATMDRRASALSALTTATNSDDFKVMDCSLVREYLRFEKLWTLREDEILSCADARKVRWILVYSILQTLISVTRAPQEVKDAEGVSYPLCCQIAGTPPWAINVKPKPASVESPLANPITIPHTIIEINPDTDCITPPSQMVPQPLSFKPRTRITRSGSVSPPKRISLGHMLSIKSPQPQRAGLCESILNSYVENSPVDRDSPSLTEGSSAWSSSSSDDGMEHNSVSGSASFYGDDEERAPSSLPGKPVELPKRTSAVSFQMDHYNPEVDQYICS